MSKLTFYVHRFDNQNDFDFITAAVGAGITSLKIEGQIEAVEHARNLKQNLLVVYRDIVFFEGDDERGFRQDYKFGVADPWEAAHAHMDLVNARLGNRIKQAYICNPYNETDISSPAARKWLNDFECERQRLYKDAGRHAAILSVGVKANLGDKLDELVGCFKIAYDNGNLIDLHAYNSPRLNDEGPFGNDVSEGLMPHRLLHDELKRRGIGVARFFFGEGGHDAIKSSGKQGKGFNGFRDIGLGNEVVVGDWAWWEEQFIKRLPVLNIAIGAAHPADKLLVGVATFLFSDAPGYQEAYNTKWSSGKGKNLVPGVAYLWLDWLRGHPGDPVPSGKTPPVTPPPVEPPPVTPPPPTQPQPGSYTVSGAVTQLRIRVSPDTKQPEVGVYYVGKRLPVDGFVQGESVSGNPWWAQIGQTFVSAFYLTK